MPKRPVGKETVAQPLSEAMHRAFRSAETTSTNNLERRLTEHQNGEGANFTKKHLPVELVYFEEFQRIDEAFYREKQVQGWSRKKKEALIKWAPLDVIKTGTGNMQAQMMGSYNLNFYKLGGKCLLRGMD